MPLMLKVAIRMRQVYALSLLPPCASAHSNAGDCASYWRDQARCWRIRPRNDVAALDASPNCVYCITQLIHKYVEMVTHSPSLFSIATGSSEPIYRQLIEQVRRLIAAAVLKPGDVLPSVRDVALALAVNPMTVSKAYNMLETEGLLNRARGVGMLVAKGNSPQGRENLLIPTLQRAAAEARQLEMDNETVIALFTKILGEAK